MSTYAKMFEAATNGEPIEAAAVGGLEDYFDDAITLARPWSEVRHVLDVPFESFASDLVVVAWSASWVVFTREYDSACSLRRWPRDPRSLVLRHNGLEVT